MKDTIIRYAGLVCTIIMGFNLIIAGLQMFFMLPLMISPFTLVITGMTLIMLAVLFYREY